MYKPQIHCLASQQSVSALHGALRIQGSFIVMFLPEVKPTRDAADGAADPEMRYARVVEW